MNIKKTIVSLSLIASTSIAFAQQDAFSSPPPDIDPAELEKLFGKTYLSNNSYSSNQEINNNLLHFNKEEKERHEKDIQSIKYKWNNEKEEIFEIIGKMSKKSPEGFSNLRLNLDDIVVKLEELFSRIYIFNFDLYSSNRRLDTSLVPHLENYPMLKYIIILKSIFPNDNDFQKEEFSDVFFDIERLGGVVDKLIQDGTKGIKNPEKKWEKMKEIIDTFVNRVINDMERPFDTADERTIHLLTKVGVKVDNNPHISEEDKKEIIFRLKQLHNFLANINPWATSIIPYGANEGPEGTH